MMHKRHHGKGVVGYMMMMMMMCVTDQGRDGCIVMKHVWHATVVR